MMQYKSNIDHLQKIQVTFQFSKSLNVIYLETETRPSFKAAQYFYKALIRTVLKRSKTSLLNSHINIGATNFQLPWCGFLFLCLPFFVLLGWIFLGGGEGGVVLWEVF